MTHLTLRNAYYTLSSLLECFSRNYFLMLQILGFVKLVCNSDSHLEGM